MFSRFLTNTLKTAPRLGPPHQQLNTFTQKRMMAIKRGSSLGLKPKPRQTQAPVEPQQQQQPMYYDQSNPYIPPPQVQHSQQHHGHSTLYPSQQGQPPPQFYNQHPNQPPVHYYPNGQQVQYYTNGQPIPYGQHNPNIVQHHPQQGQPQSLGRTVAGGILDGMTFGVGSAVAHRAMDSIMGPRTMQVEHVNAPGGAPDMGAGAPMPDQSQYQPQQWGEPVHSPEWGGEPPQQEESGGGFFSGLFGDDSSDAF